MTRPALVLEDAVGVHVKPLVQTAQGWAVDADALFRHLGGVRQEWFTNGNGRLATAWFSWTVADARTGPHATKRAALADLLAWAGLHAATPGDTIADITEGLA